MDKKPFWTSLPGVLTGIAAVITATTGIYLAVRDGATGHQSGTGAPSPPPGVPVPAVTPAASGQNERGRNEGSAARSDERPVHMEWPSVASDTFTDASSRWDFGSFSSEDSTVDLRVVEGKYRWDFQGRKPTQRWLESPYVPAVDFYVAVDARVVASSAESPQISLLFGRATNRDYEFTITKTARGTFFSLGRFDGTKNDLTIGWTPAPINVDEFNRLAVQVENQTIRLFLNSVAVGEYRDEAFSGGKTGLAVSGYYPGSIVVDFDNFEFRRKPE